MSQLCNHRWLLLALGFIVVGVAPIAGAQSGHNLERPADWMVRYDDTDAAEERRFVVMRPGWHVFAGAGGLFWDPGSFASGGYSVSSTIYLFPEGDPAQSGSTRLDCPYGLFLAGRGLGGDGEVDGAGHEHGEEDWHGHAHGEGDEEGAAAFVSFQIDNAGRFRIASHFGDSVREVAPWTASDAVATLGEDATGPVENVLAVDVRADESVFYVNDIRVAAMPAEGLPLDGVIGLRAGAGLSLHLTEIAIGPNRRAE